MKIIIYGMGRKGKQFIRDVEEIFEDIEIVAVTDTFVRKEFESNHDLMYISPSGINDYVFDYVIITPRNYYDEIKKQLIVEGIAEEKIKYEKEIWKYYGREGTYFCNLCENFVFNWKYLGENNEIFAHKKIIGAAERRGCCPICGCSDRERYVYYILQKYTSLFEDSCSSVLHFAPEQMLYQKLCYRKNYISADIEYGRADTVVDITKMQFSDSNFDYIICNHVMEHVLEEEKALSEVRRCLKEDGVFVFTAPICWEQETYEDFNINTEEERTKYYGQKDHVRLYGSDIVRRIEGFGFKVALYQSNQEGDKEYLKKMGYIEGDSVLLCQKIG